LAISARDPSVAYPLASGRPAQPVAKLRLARVGVLAWAEVEPAQELPGGLLDRRPKAVPGAPWMATCPPVVRDGPAGHTGMG
jgi:hypothetical protein